jgi:hypothetical protein
MTELLQGLTLAGCQIAWWIVRATGIGWAGLLLILVGIACSYEILIGG